MKKGNILIIILPILAILGILTAGYFYWKLNYSESSKQKGSCAKDSLGIISEDYPGQCGEACKASIAGVCLLRPLQDQR